MIMHRKYSWAVTIKAKQKRDKPNSYVKEYLDQKALDILKFFNRSQGFVLYSTLYFVIDI